MNRAEKRRQKKQAEKVAKTSKPVHSSSSASRQTSAIQQAIDLGIQHHSAGDLPKAESIYRQILQSDPNHPVATHLLGVIAHQMGKFEIAVDLFEKSLALKPDYAEAHYNLGNAFKELRKLEDAIASYREALTHKPDYAEAHNNLGSALQEQGVLDDAVASYRKALSIKPDHAGAHNNLGNALQKQGKLDDAVASYSKAILAKPDYTYAHNNLGNAFEEQGKLDDAIASYNKSIAIKPDYPEAHTNLGSALQKQGNLDDAVASHRKALSLKPDYIEAYYNLGNAFKEQGELDEAIISYKNALSLKPDFAEVHTNLGNVLQEQGKLDDAIASYRKALAIKPDFAEVHDNLGNVFQEQGELDSAVASYRKALSLKPDFAEAHRHLAFVVKHVEYDDDIQAMEHNYTQPNASDEQRKNLAFGLGKSFEELQQYEKAFEFIAEGNNLKRAEYSYSIDDDDKLFDELKKTFNPDLFAKHSEAGCDDESTIFILGMPRSGTTLVEQILSSHPQVHGAGELEALKRTVSSNFGAGGYLESLASIQQINSVEFEHAGTAYIQAIRKDAPNLRFITNKMPGNFLYLGMIKLMLPNAKVIHCRRNPIDNCLSIFKNYFIRGNDFAYDLEELGLYYNSYNKLMEHWHNVIPGFIYDVQYEEMVSDQVGQTKALLNYCGLEWDDACLEFYRSDRPVKTASSAQVRKPIYTDSVQLWKQYEEQLAPLLKVLNT